MQALGIVELPNQNWSSVQKRSQESTRVERFKGVRYSYHSEYYVPYQPARWHTHAATVRSEVKSDALLLLTSCSG